MEGGIGREEERVLQNPTEKALEAILPGLGVPPQIAKQLSRSQSHDSEDERLREVTTDRVYSPCFTSRVFRQR